jgi:predicted transcriptional regulator
MSKKLVELCSEIVQAQASHRSVSAEELEGLLSKTYNTLLTMQHAEKDNKPLDMPPEGAPQAEEGARELEMDPAKSIQKDKVVCLECGAEFRQLTANHLRSHGLTPREYKKKWGFPLKQSLAAKALTAARSKSAKKRGLPKKLQEYIESRQKKPEGTA